jgi:hypothetical protein
MEIVALIHDRDYLIGSTKTCLREYKSLSSSQLLNLLSAPRQGTNRHTAASPPLWAVASWMNGKPKLKKMESCIMAFYSFRGVFL